MADVIVTQAMKDKNNEAYVKAVEAKAALDAATPDVTTAKQKALQSAQASDALAHLLSPNVPPPNPPR